MKNAGWSYPSKKRPTGLQSFVYVQAPAWQGTKLYAELSGKVVRVDLAYASVGFSATAERLSIEDALLVIEKGLENAGFIFSPVKGGFEVIRATQKEANKALVPMHMSVTPRARHEPRRPYASAHL